MRKIAILDTSIFCCWLQVPGRNQAGSGDDIWDFARSNAAIDEAIENGASLVFPFASLIETGNHIAHAPHSRRDAAIRLTRKLREAADASTPWAAFTEQQSIWSDENVGHIIDNWPDEANRKVAIGDFTIKNVADYYSRAGFDVYIISSDRELRCYTPVRPVRKPRRRA